jgi:hypothetical protein
MENDNSNSNMGASVKKTTSLKRSSKPKGSAAQDKQSVRFVETITDEQRVLEKALARDPHNPNLRKALAALAAGVPDFYYRRDYEIVDYAPVIYDTFPKQAFRHPGPWVEGRPYAVVAGAASVYGTTVERPFSHMLAESLDINVVNLGLGGGSPNDYLNLGKPFVDLVNRAEFVVFDVMSLRSVAPPPYRHFRGNQVISPESERPVHMMPIYLDLLKRDPDALRELLSKARVVYRDVYRELCEMIEVPKILTYMSSRPIDAIPTPDRNLSDGFRRYPQFVDQELIEEVAAGFDYFVDAHVTANASLAVDRFSGEQTLWWTGKPRQSYYALQAIHDNVIAQMKATIGMMQADPQ